VLEVVKAVVVSCVAGVAVVAVAVVVVVGGSVVVVVVVGVGVAVAGVAAVVVEGLYLLMAGCGLKHSALDWIHLDY